MSTQLKEQQVPDYRVEHANGRDWIVPRGKSVTEVIAEAEVDRKSKLNTSGILPLDHRLLVLHDTVEEKTKGGIFLPDQETSKQKHAQTKATVIALGDMCWAEARHDARQFGVNATFPEPGDRVLVGRYTGDQHKGRDGKEYTVLNDTDIIAFLDKSEG